MKSVAVITGGAGGMGLATAKILGKNHHIVISDINIDQLDAAVSDLSKQGISCESIQCDIVDPTSVASVLEQASGVGKLVSVIHTAGISPQMANPQAIMMVNALGTVNVANASYSVAAEGFALVNVASMAAHVFPKFLLPRRAYPYAFTNTEKFLSKALFRCKMMPNDFYRKGMAYGISKDFVINLTSSQAAKFGEKGARIVSVSPGSFDTRMGRLEEKSGSAEMLKTAALKRFGKPEEIAELLAFCASDKASYLTGTDILCDGGVVAGRKHN